METSNKISIPLRGNNALQEVLAGASTGDQICLKDVYFTVDECTQELVSGSIDQIGEANTVKEAEDDMPEDEDTVKNRKKQPVMMVMSRDYDRDGVPPSSPTPTPDGSLDAFPP